MSKASLSVPVHVSIVIQYFCVLRIVNLFGPLKHKTVYNVVTDQLFVGFTSRIVLIQELITELCGFTVLCSIE